MTTANDTAHSNLQRTATAYNGGVLRGREANLLVNVERERGKSKLDKW